MKRQVSNEDFKSYLIGNIDAHAFRKFLEEKMRTDQRYLQTLLIDGKKPLLFAVAKYLSSAKSERKDDKAKKILTQIDVLLDMAPFLIENKNQRNETALHITLDLDLCKLLIARNANINGLDNLGAPPIFYQSDHNVVRLMLQHGANIGIYNVYGDSVIHCHLTLSSAESMKAILGKIEKQTVPDFVNKQNQFGQTPLIKAVMLNHDDSVKILLEYQANCSIQDNEAKTALHYACMGGYLQIVKMLIASLDVKQQSIDC